MLRKPAPIGAGGAVHVGIVDSWLSLAGPELLPLSEAAKPLQLVLNHSRFSYTYHTVRQLHHGHLYLLIIDARFLT